MKAIQVLKVILLVAVLAVGFLAVTVHATDCDPTKGQYDCPKDACGGYKYGKTRFCDAAGQCYYRSNNALHSCWKLVAHVVHQLRAHGNLKKWSSDILFAVNRDALNFFCRPVFSLMHAKLISVMITYFIMHGWNRLAAVPRYTEQWSNAKQAHRSTDISKKIR